MFNLPLKNRVFIYINPPSLRQNPAVPQKNLPESWCPKWLAVLARNTIFHAKVRGGQTHKPRISNEEDWFGKKKYYTWLVVEPTHLKNMLVKLGIFPR